MHIFLLVCKSQIRKFSRKKAVFLIQIRIVLPVILIYLQKYIDYKMPCYSVSKLSQKSSLNLYESFKAYHCKEKIYVLRITEVLRVQK